MKGALLVNLGSPDSTDVKDVKKYLKELNNNIDNYNKLRLNNKELCKW